MPNRRDEEPERNVNYYDLSRHVPDLEEIHHGAAHMHLGVAHSAEKVKFHEPKFDKNSKWIGGRPLKGAPLHTYVTSDV